MDAAIWAALIALLGTVITVFASHSDSGSATGAGDGAKPSATVPLTTGPTATESGGTVTSTDTDSADPATPSSTSSVSEDPTAPATTVAPPPLPTSTRHQHSVAPKPAPPNDGAAHYRYALHQGYAINLGSTSASHEATTGSWTTQNFSWGGKDDHGGDSFGISGGADSVAVLGTSAPNTHQACKSATRGGDPSLNGLNPGDRFCVFPGGFEALVTIVSNTGQFGGSDGVLTIDVLVWS
ncbi:hypothetical protein [Streptomyces sp. NPDC021020]|uniref:hypothetical protein n=1 Tax=Streptomyces sp. NPDC021020 TaxID=3365109 RepID=UPI0037922456